MGTSPWQTAILCCMFSHASGTTVGIQSSLMLSFKLQCYCLGLLLDDFRSFPKRICAFFGRPALSCPVKQTLCLLLDSPFAFKQSHTSKKISLSFAFVMMWFHQILLILCFVVFHGIQYAMILAFHMHLLSTYLVWHIDACILYPCFDNVLAFHELQTIQLPANCSLDA